jgi:hypothetical protein
MIDENITTIRFDRDKPIMVSDDFFSSNLIDDRLTLLIKSLTLCLLIGNMFR